MNLFRALAYVALLLCALFAGHARAQAPPFFPTFGMGAPGAGTPTYQLYFDTSTTPFTGYVYDRSVPAWRRFSGASATGPCSGSPDDILYTVAGTDCTGATLEWNGSQLVWAANGRIDDPGDIDTTGSFDMAMDGFSLSSTGAINLQSSTGLAAFSGVGATINATSGVLTLDGASLSSSLFGPFATANAATATADLDLFTSLLQGLAPASGGGTTNYLRADGTWDAPPAGAPGGSNGQVQYNNAGAFGGLTNTQLTADINLCTSALSGAVPSGGSSGQFLEQNCSWASLTSGSDILYGDGSGNIANVAIGPGLTFSGGTLQVTAGVGAIYNPPACASFPTLVNGDSGSPAPSCANNAGYGMTLNGGQLISTAGVRAVCQNVPGSTWTMTAGLKLNAVDIPFRGGGISVTDGTKYLIFEDLYFNTGSSNKLVTYWSSPTVNVSNPFISSGAWRFPFLQIKDDGTNLYFSVSQDGLNFAEEYQEAIGAHLGAITQICINAVPNDATLGTGNDQVTETVTYYSATSP
jgi:hypothetical protein